MTTALPVPPPIARTESAVAAVLLALAALYLVPFVARGWVPLDEGMIGQAAERVLAGQLPHVDYEEPYPGALSYLYAAVFKVAGVDLVSLRWAVFAGALASLWCVYALLRRSLRPAAAAIVTWLALVWSFPNYFSSLPSWWVLLATLVCAWAIIRYVETDRMVFVAIAGLAVGIGVTIKQTGFYLLPPLVMSLMLGGSGNGALSRGGRALDTAAAAIIGAGAFLLATLIMRTGLGSGELVYLVVPIAASSAAFLVALRSPGSSARLNWRAPAVALAAAVVPVVILLWPHLASGQIAAFVNGVFVLPQKRLEFTTLPMRPPIQIATALAALVWMTWSPRSLGAGELRVLSIGRWVIAIAMALCAMRSHVVYMFLWEAARGAAALVPIIALWLIASRRVDDEKQRRALFALAGLIAWASLGQFPFASPIYFSYVAPLALVAGVAAMQSTRNEHRLSHGPTVAAAMLFAVLCLNRGYVWNMGWYHQVQTLDTPLGLSRASLTVADFEAATYQRLVGEINRHLGPGGLVAAPDLPEVYYLSSQFSPSGRLFDFFSTRSEAEELAEWTRATVVVISHDKRFSPPLSGSMVESIRHAFPHGAPVPPFEVRWR